MKAKSGGILVLALCMTVFLAVGCGMLRASEQEKRALLRVGVYDSRCVTIACVNSKYGQQEIQKMFDIVHKAEAEGDTKTAQRTRRTAEFMQNKRHLQGFGTAPVHDLLEPVKDKLAAVAAAAQVDVIISKWEFDYLAPDAQVKDITDELVALFETNEKATNSIRQMKDIAPLSEKEILEHEH